MVDFVSYVAKNEEDAPESENGPGSNGGGSGVRRCYVFYCNGGCSRDFIASIGEAFKLGYKVSVLACHSPFCFNSYKSLFIRLYIYLLKTLNRFTVIVHVN